MQYNKHIHFVVVACVCVTCVTCVTCVEIQKSFLKMINGAFLLRSWKFYDVKWWVKSNYYVLATQFKVIKTNYYVFCKDKNWS